MKLVNGKYQRIAWDEALNEISAKMLELRKASGPDSIFIVGGGKVQRAALFQNEGVTFKTPPSVDDIASHWGEIDDLSVQRRILEREVVVGANHHDRLQEIRK